MPQLPHMVVARFSMVTGVGVASAETAMTAERMEVENFMSALALVMNVLLTGIQLVVMTSALQSEDC